MSNILSRGFRVIALLGALLLCSSSARADEVCRPCPFNCYYIGIDRKDCSDRGQRRGMCCVDLDNRGQDRLREIEEQRFGSGGPMNSNWGNNNWGNHNHNWGGNHWGNNSNWNSGNWNNGNWNNNGNHGNGNWNNGNWNNNWGNNGGSQGWNNPNRRNDPGAYDDRNGYQPGDCPPGYHVNERPCTPEERGRGCNDLRSRSGQTCVGWNQRRR